MDFGLDDEQRLIVETVRTFVSGSCTRTRTRSSGSDEVPAGARRPIRSKAIDAGLYAANMPAELGGGGLDAVGGAGGAGAGPGQLRAADAGRPGRATSCRPARATSASATCCRPIRGERHDCLAMTEPGAGSDVRSMTTRRCATAATTWSTARKHFISHADMADFVILFAATGTEEAARAASNLITGFLVDLDTPGLDVVAAARAASRTAATTSASWSSTAAGCRRPTGSARRAAASTSWASGSARAG